MKQGLELGVEFRATCGPNDFLWICWSLALNYNKKYRI
jgi:hypothetical protein